MSKKNPSLSVGRGEKLSVKAGAGLTAKGRAKLNRATGSNLQAPAPNPRTKSEKGRKASFCARMCGMKEKETSAEVAADPDSKINAALRVWGCRC